MMPLRNEEKVLAKCLDSLLANDYPHDRIEFILVDGMSTDSSPGIISSYQKKHPNIICIKNPGRIVPTGLNLAIRAAKGEFIVRVDSHTLYSTDYIRSCVELLETSGAANVGGPQTSIGTDYVSTSIALATTSRFGAGNAKFRYSDKEAWVDTVYLGAWRKDTLEKLGGFDEKFVVNQDYELNHRILASGGKILLSPRIKCQYFVRPSFSKFAKQYFRYGLWKVHTLKKHPDSLRWRQIAPPAFVLALIVSTVAGAFVPTFPWWSLWALYGIACLAAGLKVGLVRSPQHLPILPLVFAVLHFSWGLGFLIGLFRFGVPTLPFWTRKKTSSA